MKLSLPKTIEGYVIPFKPLVFLLGGFIVLGALLNGSGYAFTDPVVIKEVVCTVVPVVKGDPPKVDFKKSTARCPDGQNLTSLDMFSENNRIIINALVARNTPINIKREYIQRWKGEGYDTRVTLLN